MARSQPLMIRLATGDPRPIGRQIADGIRMKVATGELEPGVQIPSVRALAQQLAVNPNTVAKVYSELTIEGWLESQPGRGLFVATPRLRLSGDERERRLREAIDRFINEMIALGYEMDEAQARLAAAAEDLLPRKRA